MMLNFVFCYKSHTNNASKEKYKNLRLLLMQLYSVLSIYIFSLLVSKIMAIMNLPTLAIFLYVPGFGSQ